MQNFNYHTHTYRCGHADPSIFDEEYVELFIKKGFKKIAFTDHCPHKERFEPINNIRMDYTQKEDYYNSIDSLKEKYKDVIEIEKGFEFEYLPSLKEYLKELKSETDKMVLGQHFVYSHEGNYISIGWQRAKDEDLISYARHIEMAMKEGLPDIVAHPDLFMLNIDKFGEIEEKVTRIICEAAEKYNVPLEINLSRAIRYICKITNRIEYPNKDFWRIATDYNIKVLYGVDAHYRNQIELYEESVKIVNDHLGKDIIEKLKFCDEKL